jgi:6-phosphogluconolactonase
MQIDWAQPGDPAAVAERVARVVARPGAKRIAVPGGATPAAVFAELAARELEWRGCEVWPTDDRQVPPEHPASNFGKLHAALGGSGAMLVELREGKPSPRFDLVWLGMGADGHVASLFPRMAAGERVGPCVITTVPEPLPREAPFARLSLNLEALTATEALIVAITGGDKRRVIEAAIRGEPDGLPIGQLLRAARCPIEIFWSP